ncbi:symmetrical bis(5'-nucleosyl)-tetraphosphatase [Castellaniella hirudinis]|uniref:bis(5'-nucleosyl)-tetraphosphatase (symmetrical) n=1 Tax=Castellaniella hirudinis TaxID=1144617 RepID=A0ABV8RUR0_9BURK
MTLAATPRGDVWVIGDIQGCAGALRALLDHPELARSDTELWFAGDLVNRGPDSLGALRLIQSLGPRARAILGNHDLHLLAVVAGVRPPGKSDTFQDILSAPDAAELIDWLRHRPLLVRDRGHVMVHAGILPAWTLDQAQALAGEIETAIRRPDWHPAMHDLYGEEPLQWDDALQGPDRMRVIVNALTRMRVCHADDGRMNFRHKAGPHDNPELVPWFELPGRRDPAEPVVFGHWSALGLHIRPDAICLDTGCVWGRALTALRLRDHKIVQQDCATCR